MDVTLKVIEVLPHVELIRIHFRQVIESPAFRISQQVLVLVVETALAGHSTPDRINWVPH
jgi:hypothetical protein